MKIELMEDNGCLNGGIPTLVVLQVTNDSGKTMRLPYQADKTIQELYQDIAKIEGSNFNSSPVIPSGPIKRIVNSILDEQRPGSPDPKNNIEREDLVKCVTVIKREFGVDLNAVPEKGKIYRVIDIKKAGGEVMAFEVLDDVANNKIRMTVLKDEVVLHEKHVPPAPRIEVFSVTKLCQCGEINAIPLSDKGDLYRGNCTKCNADLVEPRFVGRVPDLPLELQEAM